MVESNGAGSLPRPAQVLTPEPPWDFQCVFPAPTEEAVREGVLTHCLEGEPPTSEAIAAIHDEHAREMVANLDDIQHLRHCRANKLSPATGKPLTSRSKPVDFLRLIREHWRQHRLLLDVYENAFGRMARRAFDRHCVAAAEGVLIIELGTKELPLPREIEQIADDEERRRRSIAWFDSRCPGIWVPGVRLWNVDQVGPYRVGRGLPVYVPEHPYYYHRAGVNDPPEHLVALAQPASPDQLNDLAFGRKRRGDDREALARHEAALQLAIGRYRAFRDEGPRRLAVCDKTSGRFGKTPVTLWAEAMPLLRAAVTREASIVKGLNERAEKKSNPDGDIGSQMELF